jgi:hypothetical protein
VGIAFVSHGVAIGVRMNDEVALDRLIPHLPPGWQPAPSPVVEVLYSLAVAGPGQGTRPRRSHLLCLGPDQAVRSENLDDLCETLSSWLRLSVAVRARRRVFVHAGVVGWRGRGLLVPGRSHSGKTTLVAALVEAGATYYSDEYAVLDSHGRVFPFPKPLSLRQGDGQRSTLCPAQALGGSTGDGPLPVGLVVITKYEPGARWRPRMRPAAEGLLALLDNTPAARARPKTVLRTLRQVAAGAVTLQTKRGEAADVAGRLLDALAEDGRRAVPCGTGRRSVRNGC